MRANVRARGGWLPRAWELPNSGCSGRDPLRGCVTAPYRAADVVITENTAGPRPCARRSGGPRRTEIDRKCLHGWYPSFSAQRARFEAQQSDLVRARPAVLSTTGDAADHEPPHPVS